MHSAEENLDDGIPISEKRLNDFNIQIILEVQAKPDVILEVPFKNKLRRIIASRSFGENYVIKMFTKYIKPNRLVAIYADDDIFRTIQEVYSVYFANNKDYRLIRCAFKVKDITENDEQDEIIRLYHINNNHRGIDETYLHLKRKYFFPYMRN